MSGARSIRNNLVRPIALAVLFTVFGSLLRMLLDVLLDIKISTLQASAITFVVAAFGAFFVFPKLLKQPFGDVGLREYSRRLGFYLPRHAWKHMALGAALALCTLSGMLIGSILTGRYVFDWSTVKISHILFCINPGLWEEFFHRGIILFVLLRFTRSVPRAALLQIVLFGLVHIKGVALWAWIDAVSVTILAVGFTYVAWKTRTLIAGIVFHFLHDAFLFLPQVPGGEYTGFGEKAGFYVALWTMVGVACLLTRLAADKLGVQAEEELYTLDKLPDEPETEQPPLDPQRPAAVS